MATKEQAQSWLEWMDSDGDGKVQMDEFIEAMGRYMEFLDDENFNAGVEDILNDRALRMGFGEDEEVSYVHPAENREYLAGIVPVLDEALNALCLHAQQDRVELAAGKDWVDGYMPDDWKPFNPLQWLGDWLLEYEKRHNAGEPEEPEEEVPKPFAEMTRTEKIELCLNSISDQGTTPGELPLNTILSNTVLITTPSTLATARRNFKWLGSPGDTLVSVKEAASALEEVAGVLEFTDEVFESKIYKMLNQNSLHVLSAPEKYTMAFHHIDFDNSGELDLDELVKFGRMLNLTPTWKRSGRAWTLTNLAQSLSTNLSQRCRSLWTSRRTKTQGSRGSSTRRAWLVKRNGDRRRISPRSTRSCSSPAHSSLVFRR